jgi:hypothetical protein
MTENMMILSSIKQNEEKNLSFKENIKKLEVIS